MTRSREINAEYLTSETEYSSWKGGGKNAAVRRGEMRSDRKRRRRKRGIKRKRKATITRDRIGERGE